MICHSTISLVAFLRKLDSCRTWCLCMHNFVLFYIYVVLIHQWVIASTYFYLNDIVGLWTTMICEGRFLIRWLIVLVLHYCEYPRQPLCPILAIYGPFSVLIIFFFRNLSYNNLSGVIPSMKNFSRFSADRYCREAFSFNCFLYFMYYWHNVTFASFFGNSLLCGDWVGSICRPYIPKSRGVMPIPY